MKKILGFAAAVLVLGVVIWIADPAATFNTIKGIDLYWFSLGVIIWIISVAVRSFRWSRLLDVIGMKVGFWRSMEITIIATLIAHALPARNGDPLKSVILKRRFGHSFSWSIMAVMMEKMGNLIAFSAMAAVGIFVLDIHWAAKAIIGGILALVAASIWFLWIVSSRERAHGTGKRLMGAMSFFSNFIRKREKKLASKFRNMAEAFEHYKNPRAWAWTILLSAIGVLADGLIMWASFKAIGVDVSILLLSIAVPVIIMVGVVSLLPGGVGSTEAASVLLLVALAQVTLTDATAATIISRIITWWLYVLVGGFVMLKLHRAHEVFRIAKNYKRYLR